MHLRKNLQTYPRYFLLSGINPTEDSSLLHDPDFISTHHQNHDEYHCPQNSDVYVASKIQAKNKESSFSLTGNENAMLALFGHHRDQLIWRQLGGEEC